MCKFCYFNFKHNGLPGSGCHLKRMVQATFKHKKKGGVFNHKGVERNP